MTALRNLLSLKPGLRTTEFWAHAIVSLISLLVAVGLVPVGLPQRDQTWVQLGAFLAAALATGLYALSRGKVKAGASSLVTLLDHAITTLYSGGPESETLAKDLLYKVIPELNGIVPGSGELAKLVAVVKAHEATIEDLVSKLAHFSFAVTPVPVASVTGNYLQTPDALSSANEPADGTSDPGPGGFPSDVATEPVLPTPVAVPAAAVTSSPVV